MTDQRKKYVISRLRRLTQAQKDVAKKLGYSITYFNRGIKEMQASDQFYKKIEDWVDEMEEEIHLERS